MIDVWFRTAMNDVSDDPIPNYKMFRYRDPDSTDQDWDRSYLHFGTLGDGQPAVWEIRYTKSSDGKTPGQDKYIGRTHVRELEVVELHVHGQVQACAPGNGFEHVNPVLWTTEFNCGGWAPCKRDNIS